MSRSRSCQRRAKRLRARTDEPIQRGQSGGGEASVEMYCRPTVVAALLLIPPFCSLFLIRTDGCPPRKKQKTSHPGPGSFGRLARRVKLGLQRLGPRAPEVVRRTLGAGETGSGRPSFLAQDNVHYLLRESIWVLGRGIAWCFFPLVSRAFLHLCGLSLMCVSCPTFRLSQVTRATRTTPTASRRWRASVQPQSPGWPRSWCRSGCPPQTSASAL
jgi:hypothetical protein